MAEGVALMHGRSGQIRRAAFGNGNFGNDAAVNTTVLSADTVSALVRSSRFESRTPVPEDLSSAHLVTLSTCSYEFEDARFVVVGVLIPIDPVAAPTGSGE